MSLQYVFNITIECSDLNSIKIFSFDGHVLFHNDVPKYLNQICNLLLLVIEYSRVNNFLLILFSFKCT